MGHTIVCKDCGQSYYSVGGHECPGTVTDRIDALEGKAMADKTFDRVEFAEKAFLTLLSSSPEIEMNEKNLRVLAQYAFICAEQFEEALLDDIDEEPGEKEKDDD